MQLNYFTNIHLLIQRFINSLCVITINTPTDVQMTVGGEYLHKWKPDLGKRLRFDRFEQRLRVYNAVRYNAFFSCGPDDHVIMELQCSMFTFIAVWAKLSVCSSVRQHEIFSFSAVSTSHVPPDSKTSKLQLHQIESRHKSYSLYTYQCYGKKQAIPSNIEIHMFDSHFPYYCWIQRMIVWCVNFKEYAENMYLFAERDSFDYKNRVLNCRSIVPLMKSLLIFGFTCT